MRRACVLFLLLAGCRGELTELLVVVDSDMPLAQLDGVRVEVTGVQTSTASGAISPAEPLPRTVGLVHQGGSLGPVRVRAIGTHGGTDVVSVQAITSFEQGRTLILPMMLAGSCRAVSCTGDQTCLTGACADANIPSSALDEYNGTIPHRDGGTCMPSAEVCNGRDDDCDGMADEDFHLDTDPANCGGCGVACSFANATSECVARACRLQTCTAGFDDCDRDPTNGCEVDLSSTAAHCGSCSISCTRANAMTSCQSSACAIDSCNAGFDDCNNDESDGCETALTTLTDCGTCGTPCTVATGTPSCTTGTCRIASCGALTEDCNMSATDGCETMLTTLTDCGACRTPCATPNATPTCSTGTCAIESCTSGFGDCNTSAADGCETALNTLTDCAACRTPCSLANGTETCAPGACAIVMCDANFDDCDGLDSTGCEADLRMTANCGRCGNTCGPGQRCRMGTCR